VQTGRYTAYDQESNRETQKMGFHSHTHGLDPMRLRHSSRHPAGAHPTTKFYIPPFPPEPTLGAGRGAGILLYAPQHADPLRGLYPGERPPAVRLNQARFSSEAALQSIPSVDKI
jgi:hypothetical protein